MSLTLGSEAPDFELPSSELEDGRPGKKIKLSDFRGKKHVVLAFYPLDFSPVCSGEMSCFKDDFAGFDKLDAQVLGISIDSVWTHLAFAKAQGLSFPLLADFHPKGAVATQFGLYHADKGITARATVIVDKSGKIAFVQDHGFGTPRDDKALLAALEALG
ncbi:MAG: redoxin domain-containing protein [Deltaproteobacteria bacterium]|nr:redoxin domain-containing protein [Deltaproteobacteria bacterium]